MITDVINKMKPATTCIKDRDGAMFCYSPEGHLHSEDGPAVVRGDGTKMWYSNGSLHRLDGPALEHISGYRVWFIKGRRHRTDGPAVIYANGNVAWYLHDAYFYNASDWAKKVLQEQHAQEPTEHQVQEYVQQCLSQNILH